MAPARPFHGGTIPEILILVLILATLSLAVTLTVSDQRGRALVADAQEEMGHLAQALEAYRVDWAHYPQCNTFALACTKYSHVPPRDWVLERLSTPVSYIAESIVPDPFSPERYISVSSHFGLPGTPHLEDTSLPGTTAIRYASWDDGGRTLVLGDMSAFGDGHRPASSWALESSGPDRIFFTMGGILSNFTSEETADIIYDPTNGLISYGAIFRVGGDLSSDYGRGFTLGVQAYQTGLPFDQSGLVHR